jgi:phospholipid transport system transporter-binding protein
MISRNGDKLYVQGAITVDNVASVIKQGVALFDRPDLVIDLAQVTEVDSSAISMLLEWQRKAREQNRQICFSNIPKNMKNLAQLYGISELIPLT